MPKPAAPPTRRTLLIGAALIGAAPLAAAQSAQAAGTLSRAAAKYQDHPQNGQVCSACRYFLAAKAKGQPNLCELVAGPIDANGWCMLYAAKPK